jgi:hypothetical protein
LITWRKLFSDVPDYSSVLKSVDSRFVPTSPVDDFSEVVAELAKEADELADK